MLWLLSFFAFYDIARLSWADDGRIYASRHLTMSNADKTCCGRCEAARKARMSHLNYSVGQDPRRMTDKKYRHIRLR